MTRKMLDIETDFGVAAPDGTLGVVVNRSLFAPTSGPYAPADETEAVYDGDLVVCPDCGCVGSATVDEDDAYIVWRDDEALTDAAFGGFRRLLRLP